MKLIELSKQGWKNKGKYFAMVDDEDYEWLNSFNWCAVVTMGCVYVSREDPKTKTAIGMHQMIMGTFKTGLVVDHIDHNGLNNQRNNLRACTQSQNRKNSKTKRKYKGSYKCKVANGFNFKSIIIHNYKTYYLGMFPTEVEAAVAYDKKAKELFGEFANLNF